MKEPNEIAAAVDRLNERKSYYHELGHELRGTSDGEPDNTGKGIKHFLERVHAFATSGQVVNIVTLRKREAR